MDDDDRERRAISRAKERLAQYAPEPGKEDCPICFVFDAKEMKRALSFHAEGSGPVKATCSSCGFTGSIPHPWCRKWGDARARSRTKWAGSSS